MTQVVKTGSCCHSNALWVLKPGVSRVCMEYLALALAGVCIDLYMWNEEQERELIELLQLFSYVRTYVCIHMHCPESEEAMIDFYYKMKSCHKIYEGVMAYVCTYMCMYV